MDLERLGLFLIVFAVVIAITGAAVYLIGKSFGISKLPGDIEYRRGPVRIIFPIVTSIIISLILTIVLNVLFWLLRR